MQSTPAIETTALGRGVALDVRDLRVTYTGTTPVQALGGVSFSIRQGECLGLLGESGSGKSTLARALLGILTEARVEGTIDFDRTDLTALDEQAWRPVRWARVAMAFQSQSALNPVLRVSDQVAEPLIVHADLHRHEAADRARRILADVGLDASAVDRYPSELSGGQQRLVLIAIALACDPELLVLDEPTGGLDTVTRAHVLSVLAALRGRKAMLLISHDVEAIAALADRVAVLYRGWMPEVGPTGAVLEEPRHPYSWALLNARPTLAGIKDLRGIRGDAPDPTVAPLGCPFVDRCTQAVDACRSTRPELLPLEADGDRHLSCLRGGLVTVLAARDLRKSFVSRSGVARRSTTVAVDGVSLDIREGEVVGLVGPTASGKSTVARLLLRLVEADGGSVTFEGADLFRIHGRELKAARPRLQMLFQNPYEALSARLTVAQAVREPLDVQGIGGAADRDRMVRDALEAVGLSVEAFASRRSSQLSGGQLQRVALARALILQPKLLVADEPVTHLDLSEQTKVLQLLKTTQVERGMAMLLIAHELAVVLRVADRVVVLDHGRVVEEGRSDDLFVAPQHPVTRALLAGAGRDDLLARMQVPHPPASARHLADERSGVLT